MTGLRDGEGGTAIGERMVHTLEMRPRGRCGATSSGSAAAKPPRSAGDVGSATIENARTMLHGPRTLLRSELVK